VSEPVEVAAAVEPVVEGVWHWRIANSNIGGYMSSSHAVADGDRSVLINPVRLAEAALADLPRPRAICLGSKGHQRAAWRYRRDFDAEVWLPEGTPPPDEEPDHRYRERDALPGGLRAVLTPGPAKLHFSLLREREPGVLFCGDLLSNVGDEGLDFVPLEYHDDPAQTRRTVEQLLDLPFDVLCLDHGQPIADDPKGEIRRLLERTA
jgi:glyoxylase-like metal-dependent hydrolase (beta-lactamase superfamily II)